MWVACLVVAWASGGGRSTALCLVLGEEDFAEHGRYGVFMFPPPGTCFPHNAAVYVATALSDGLFTNQRVRRDGIKLLLYINGNEMASVVWDPRSDQEADEGLAHHFSIPGLPDGNYEAELSIFLLGGGDLQVGSSAVTDFHVDNSGNCLHDQANEPKTVPTEHQQATPHKTLGGRAAHGGSGGGEKNILVNVAVGKRAWMSSVAADSHASYAVDGLTMISPLVQRNALSAVPPAPSSLFSPVNTDDAFAAHPGIRALNRVLIEASTAPQ